MTIIFQTILTFELTYNAPDGSVGMWQRGGFEPIKSEERAMLTEEEQNQLNIERRASRASNISSKSHSSDGHTIEGEEDGMSIQSHSSPSKSVFGSRLSLASKLSGGKSPKM